MTTEDPTAERPSRPARTPAGEPGRRGTAALGAAAPTRKPVVPTRTLALVGTALWAVALVVTLVVPALHTGQRSWWPWSCVTGIALGVFALWYVRPGGNNADA